jgi:hypothetical protein
VYVTPVEGMMVRPGQHVDPEGKIYHPYLVGWAEFWDVSDFTPPNVRNDAEKLLPPRSPTSSIFWPFCGISSPKNRQLYRDNKMALLVHSQFNHPLPYHHCLQG